MKKNNTENYESIILRITKDKFPIVCAAKKQELINVSGMSDEEAEDYLSDWEVEMEMYYEEGRGLFMVEAEAVECTPIYSPYTQEELEENDEE